MREKDIETLKERAKEMLDNNYSRKIGDEELYTIICKWENAAKELETYKKIAKKLAYYTEDTKLIVKDCLGWNCTKGFECTDCIIDVARKEVDKDV